MPDTEKSQIQLSYIERELRAAGANPYLVVLGVNTLDNQGHMDGRFDAWPRPVIVPLSGNWLGNLSAQPLLTCGHAPATALTLADEADAMLYMACAESQDWSPRRTRCWWRKPYSPLIEHVADVLFEC